MAAMAWDSVFSSRSDARIPLNVLLLGVQGLDIHATVNSVLGAEVFNASKAHKQIAEKEVKVKDRRVILKDASALCSPQGMEKLHKHLRTARPTDAFIYTVQIGASAAAVVAEEDIVVLKALGEKLGDAFWDSCLLVALNRQMEPAQAAQVAACRAEIRAATGMAPAIEALNLNLPTSGVNGDAERIVDELARVVRFTKPFVPRSSTPVGAQAPASASAELFDLSAIMDANLELAGPTPRPSQKASETFEVAPTPPKVESASKLALAELNPVQAINPSPAVRAHPPPIPAAASLSLALTSALSSLALPSVVSLAAQGRAVSASRAAAPQAVALPSKLGAARKAKAVPSQQECHRATPVMSALAMPAQMATPEPQAKAFRPIAGHVSAFPDLKMLPANARGLGNPSGVAGGRKAAIVWFRNDLRVHDNEALALATRESLSVLPVYCFDPRDYGKSSSGFDKTGPYRARFLLDCVADLRRNLRARGSDLVVRVGRPEEVLPALARSTGAEALYAHQEVTYEELLSEDKVAAALKEEGVETKLFWGSTLYHTLDLPFALDATPSNFGGFKEAVQGVKVRPTAEVPAQLKALPTQGGVRVGSIPTLRDLGLPSASSSSSSSSSSRQDKGASASQLVGGETEALDRLQRFVAEAKAQKGRGPAGKAGGPAGAVKGEGGESLYGANFSCKISPWLAMGCLSPRKMYEDLEAASKASVKGVPQAKAAGRLEDDANLNWLVFELLWRDFFRFITKKYGAGRKSQGGPASAPALASGTSAVAGAPPALAAV